MKASELRIGNFVEFDGEESKIESISLGVKSGHVVYLECYGDLILFDHLEPIPLTEEWLVKFGFEEKDGYFTKNKDDIYNNYTDNSFDYVINGIVIIEIKHVHQLQNLYFALTGEELKIQL